MTSVPWRDHLTTGKPDPPTLVAPKDGWPGDLAAVAADEHGYPIVTPGASGQVEIPADFAGLLTVRAVEGEELEVVIGGGAVHLRILVEGDNPIINLSFREEVEPKLTGASYGRQVSPSYTNGDHGLRLLEISKPFSSLGEMSFPRRRVVLRPGHALVSRPVWLWLHGISLHVDAPPVATPAAGPTLTITGEPPRCLCNGEGGVVLAPGNISLEHAAEVQPIAEVRALGASPHAPSSLDCHIDRLRVHTGAHMTILRDRYVNSASLHRPSRLGLAEFCAVVVLEAASPDPEVAVHDDAVSTVVVGPRSSDHVTAVGRLVGPLRVELQAAQGASAEHDRPGELWIQERADLCTFSTDARWHRPGQPPTVRWTSGATGSGLRFERTLDEDRDPPREAVLAVHLDERSAIYDASGSVAVRAAARATIDGSAEGITVDRIVDPDRPRSGAVESTEAEPGQVEEDDHAETTSEGASPLPVVEDPVFQGAHISRVQIDLASHHGHRILEELREAELVELHHRTWSPNGSPLGCRSPVAGLSLGKRCWHTLAGWPRPSHSERQQELGLEVLSDVSRSKARSGTVRSGVAHAVLTTRSGRTAFIPERLILLAGRALGFGHRIGRPLAVWLTLSVAVAALAMADGGFDASLSGLGRLFSGSANALAEPAGIVRGVRPEPWLDTQLDRQWMVTGARIVLAVPLGAAVLAIARRSRTR